MKKTKLLTSLAALALVLSLGACTEPEEEEEETSEDTGTVETETESESESTPSETTTEGGTTGGTGSEDPVSDIFDALESGESFTLNLYYYELTSDYYSTSEQAKAAGYEYYTEANVIITYTPDAVVLEYYLYGQFVDAEAYVNDYNDQAYQADLVIYFELDENGDLATNWYGWYGTWQQIMDSPLALIDYRDAFTAGELGSGDYGATRDYDIDLSVDGLFSALITDVFTAENWLVGYYIAGPSRISSIYNQGLSYYDVSSTYYYDLEEWDIDMETYDMIWSGTLYGQSVSWLEYDFMEAMIYDVGTTVIDPQWAQYLVLS